MPSGFRRQRKGGGANAWLNYGYAVLRALVARSICSAGLHPSIGLQHHNRYDAFALAADLMEPYRPCVDQIAAEAAHRGIRGGLDKAARRALVQAVLDKRTDGTAWRAIPDHVARTTASLVAVLEGRQRKLTIPRLRWDAME